LSPDRPRYFIMASCVYWDLLYLSLIHINLVFLGDEIAFEVIHISETSLSAFCLIRPFPVIFVTFIAQHYLLTLRILLVLLSKYSYIDQCLKQYYSINQFDFLSLFYTCMIFHQ